MSRIATFILTTLLCLCAGSVLAQSTKPGLWDIQHKVGGNPEVDRAMAKMQQQMAAMPAEQRKMMQEMLARQGASMPGAAAGGGMSMKVCITPEMAARSELPRQTEGDCTTTITSRSGNMLKMRFVCKNPPASGEGTYTFTGDTAYTMNMVMKSQHEGRPMTTSMEGQGKWLSADCGNIKPLK